MAVFFITKYINSCSLELFFSYVFMYGKLGFLMLFVFSDVRLACWYFFACICLWLLLQNPRYTGKSKLIKPLSQNELAGLLNIEEIERFSKATSIGKQQRGKARDFARTESTMLVFTAGWADMCYFTYAMWYKFASKYTTGKVRFVEIDITKY